MDDAINITDLTEAELTALLRGRADNKYRNRKVEDNGMWFDSLHERNRWHHLDILRRTGSIRRLLRQHWVEVQPAFDYEGQHIRAVRLRLDFSYEELGNDGRWYRVLEDAKGVMTPAYAIKWKMLQYKFRNQPGVILRLVYK